MDNTKFKKQVYEALKNIKDIPTFQKSLEINYENMKRASSYCSDIKRAYSLIYQSKLNLSQAVEEIEQNFNLTGEVSEILDFIKRSDRGLI